MADQLTGYQRQLARDALGLREPGTKTTSNYFVVGTLQSARGQQWLDMVNRGLAVKISIPDKVLCAFKLTRAGAEAALDPGEMLDPEDFPNG